jgi:RNA polymerase sigma factor (sigma-70 family)
MEHDRELLRHFAATSSEDAFAELVRRHLNLVYSAALRQVNGDAHFAQDIAQTVFSSLARNADALSRRATLVGWLFTSVHFAAAKIVRTENRRRDREEEFMREPLQEGAPELDWERLRPLLDAAMHELKDVDREAVLLRYFENRQFNEVGAKLGLNENAARMRVERALQKLRDILAERGITTATQLGSVISANAIQMAPANLAATLTKASIAGVGTGIFSAFKVVGVTKLKLAVSALFVIGLATVLLVQHQAQKKMRAINESLSQQLTQLQTDNESLSNRLAATDDAKSLSDKEFNELLRLRGETGLLRQQTNALGTLLASQTKTVQEMQRFEGNVIAKERWKEIGIAKMGDARSYAYGILMFAQDNQGQLPISIDQITCYLTNAPSTPNPVPTGTNRFDIVYLASLDGLTNPTSIIVLKESQAWQTDVKWQKTYGFADGHSEIHTQTNDNYDEFEQQHSVSPRNN